MPTGSRGTLTGGPGGGANGPCAAPEDSTACGGGVKPGNGGMDPAEGDDGDGGVAPEAEEAEGAEDVEELSEAEEPEGEEDVPAAELPEAFCVYQAGGA